MSRGLLRVVCHVPGHILLDHSRGFARAARTWSEIVGLVGDTRKTIGEVDTPTHCRIT